MKKIAILILLTFLFVKCEEKQLIEIQPNQLTNIGAVNLSKDVVLLHSSTPALLMAPGEATILMFNKLASEINDSIATLESLTSSNPDVVAVTVDGKVTAKQTGASILRATTKDGKMTAVSVVVQTDNLPELSEPYAAGFSKPLYFINSEKNQRVDVKPLNRLGQEVNGQINLIFSGKDIQSTTELTPPSNGYVEEGFYRLTAAINEKPLLGEVAIGVYKEAESNLIPNIFPDKPTSEEELPKVPTVILVTLQQGKYPQYFTKKGLQSESIRGLVYKAIPTIVNGKVQIMVTTSLEEVNVETENNSVISANGSRIVSVKEGFGRWRAISGNYFGPWYASQVFVNLSGGWICEDDQRGKMIAMVIPEIPAKVVHAGIEGDIYEIYSIYGYNDKMFPSLAYREQGKAQYIDKITNVKSDFIDIQIGPFQDCLICTSQETEVQRPGWNFGAMNFVNNNRYGPIKYMTDDSSFKLIDDQGNELIFVRSEVNLEQPVGITLNIDGTEVFFPASYGVMYKYYDYDEKKDFYNLRIIGEATEWDVNGVSYRLEILSQLTVHPQLPQVNVKYELRRAQPSNLSPTQLVVRISKSIINATTVYSEGSWLDTGELIFSEADQRLVASFSGSGEVASGGFHIGRRSIVSGKISVPFHK